MRHWFTCWFCALAISERRTQSSDHRAYTGRTYLVDLEDVQLLRHIRMGSTIRSLRCSWFSVWPLVIWIFVLCSQASAANTRWIPFTTDEGTVYLDDDRRPALYTGDFGDCQGDSLINITRFDASLYRDNLTVMFHMAGTTDLPKQHVMSKLQNCNR